MHLRNVEISVEISDETSFFLEKIKNLGQNLGHFGPKLSKTVVAGEGAFIKHERVLSQVFRFIEEPL